MLHHVMKQDMLYACHRPDRNEWLGLTAYCPCPNIADAMRQQHVSAAGHRDCLGLGCEYSAWNTKRINMCTCSLKGVITAAISISWHAAWEIALYRLERDPHTSCHHRGNREIFGCERKIQFGSWQTTADGSGEGKPHGRVWQQALQECARACRARPLQMGQPFVELLCSAGSLTGRRSAEQLGPACSARLSELQVQGSKLHQTAIAAAQGMNVRHELPGAALYCLACPAQAVGCLSMYERQTYLQMQLAKFDVGG